MNRYDEMIEQWLTGDEDAARQHLRDIIVTTASRIYESQGTTPPTDLERQEREREFDKLMQQNAELDKMRAQLDQEKSEEERIYKLPRGYYPPDSMAPAAPTRVPTPREPMFPKFTPGAREVSLEQSDEKSRRDQEYWNFGKALRDIEKGTIPPRSTAPAPAPAPAQPPAATAPAAPARPAPPDAKNIPAPRVPWNEPGVNKRVIEAKRKSRQ